LGQYHFYVPVSTNYFFNILGAYGWYGYYKGHGDHGDDHDDDYDMEPQHCGDKLDYEYGMIHSEGYPAGTDNTNECAWQKDYGNSSKVCYDICFYSEEGKQKVWSKEICVDLEYGSGCTK
jgi:hypothetical protein